MKRRWVLGLLTAVCVALSGTASRAADGETSRASNAASTQAKRMEAQSRFSTSPTLSSGTTPTSTANENGWNAEPKAGTLKSLSVKGIEYRFRYCPAGTFLMGSPENEEDRGADETQRRVTLTEGFWTLETEVTQAMWTSLMGNNPSAFSADGAHSSWMRKRDTSNYPVEQVSWNDCQDFVDKLNESGLAPEGFKFRLPTEAEWEYACRAGATTPFSWGSSLNGTKANCDGNYPYRTSKTDKYLGRPTKVGGYAPNAWGLYDMHGNVLEWCADWYDAEFYKNLTQVQNPLNLTKTDAGRSARGGGWNDGAKCCRAAARRGFAPTFRFQSFGFRLVLGRVRMK